MNGAQLAAGTLLVSALLVITAKPAEARRDIVTRSGAMV